MLGEQLVDGVYIAFGQADAAHRLVASDGVPVDRAVDSQRGERGVLPDAGDTDPVFADGVGGVVWFVLFAGVAWVDPARVFEFIGGDDELADRCAVV